MKEHPFYAPIITDITRTIFLDYISSIRISPIDYFSIGVTNRSHTKYTCLTSRLEWQKYMIKNEIANHDPVVKAKRFARRRILPFSEIDYTDSFGKEIMQQRKLHGIKNGLLLVHCHNHTEYMVIVATEYLKFNHWGFLKQYYAQLSRLKHDFIKIIEKDVQHFLMS